MTQTIINFSNKYNNNNNNNYMNYNACFTVGKYN